jgi:hypothetical protein
MRFIEIQPDLRVRFPGQSEEFSLGVEVGVLATLMSGDLREFTHMISPLNVDQVRELAERFGYQIFVGVSAEEKVCVTLARGFRKPALRLVR